ncbi:MAG: Hpt domain-containing protein [Cyanobacteria bacterium P01_D01_bin.1]
MWHGQQSTLPTDTLPTDTLPTDFDWQQLRQLAGGDANFEAELLKMFLADAKINLKQLERAIASKSIKTIEDVAHSLRGASANVGAIALAGAASQLEGAARAGEMTDAQKLLRRMDTHCQKIQAYVQR